jgi:tetratricopeptide (TPR) repeat protein
LIGDSEGAKIDLEKSLDILPSFVQSWVKIASVHMELGDPASAFGDFEAAIRHNPDDADIYYHRGQGKSSFYALHGQQADEQSTLSCRTLTRLLPIITSLPR